MEKNQNSYIAFDSIENKDLSHDEKENIKDENELLHSLDSNQHKTDHKIHNPLLGYAFMFLAMMGMTTNHFFGKLAMYNNPNLSSFDVILSIGI